VKPRAVRLLSAGADADWMLSGGVLGVRVPSVQIHEVIAIDV